jgi:hypothetical protein
MGLSYLDSAFIYFVDFVAFDRGFGLVLGLAFLARIGATEAFLDVFLRRHKPLYISSR